jgi:tetratricopeptide (TPR) repeat protein
MTILKVTDPTTALVLAATAAFTAWTSPLSAAPDTGDLPKKEAAPPPPREEHTAAEDKVAAATAQLQKADTLAAVGSYAEAEKNYRAAIAGLSSSRPADDLQLLGARESLGDMLHDEGKLGAAQKEYIDALIAREHIANPTHLGDSLLPMKVLSEISYKGKFADVEKEYHEALTAKKSAFEAEMKRRTDVALQEIKHGAEAPETLKARTDLARTLADEGESKDALDIYHAVIAVQTHDLGANSPATLETRLDMARAQQKSGAKGTAAFEAIVSDCTSALGAENPQTLHARLALAEALRNGGDQPGAEKEYRAVREILDRAAPGAPSEQKISCLLGLSHALEAQQKYLDAEKEARAALLIQTHDLGAEHPDTLATRMFVTSLLCQQNHYPIAEKEYRAILAIREKTPGPGKHETYQTQLALVDTLQHEKKYKDALELVKRVQADLEKSPDNSITPSYLNQLRGSLESAAKGKKRG